MEHKFRHEVHANEIVLLAYYIAAINIEAVYHGLQGGEYVPFEGICLSVKATVTNKSTYIVVGDQDLSVLAGYTKSSKHRKAEEMREAGHPIKIIGESEFRRLVVNDGEF